MPTDENIVGETSDPNGARIVLLDRVWRDKVVLDHPEMASLVVVSYEQEPARIVSAFANRKDPPTWSA